MLGLGLESRTVMRQMEASANLSAGTLSAVHASLHAVHFGSTADSACARQPVRRVRDASGRKWGRREACRFVGAVARWRGGAAAWWRGGGGGGVVAWWRRRGGLVAAARRCGGGAVAARWWRGSAVVAWQGCGGAAAHDPARHRAFEGDPLRLRAATRRSGVRVEEGGWHAPRVWR